MAEWTLGLISVLIIGFLGVVGKLMFGAVRDGLVSALTKAVTDTLNTRFNLLTIQVDMIQEDITYIKNNGLDTKRRIQQGADEVEHLRQRVDAHLDRGIVA